MIVAAIRKDVALLVRDRGALISLFALPIIFTVTFGSVFHFGPLAAISGFQVAVPGNAVLFGFFIALTVATVLVGERRTGTLQRVLAAPVRRSHALIATLVPYYLIGVVQLAFLFGVGAIVFDMRIEGSLGALIAISLAVSYCAVTLGLLFAAVTSSEKMLAGTGAVVLLVMGMLGGCMVPRLLMPERLQTLGLASPHAWALDAYYLVLARPGTTLADVALPIGVLLAYGTLFGAIGLARFRFE